jgi:hypothetical protein
MHSATFFSSFGTKYTFEFPPIFRNFVSALSVDVTATDCAVFAILVTKYKPKQ